MFTSIDSIRSEYEKEQAIWQSSMNMEMPKHVHAKYRRAIKKAEGNTGRTLGQKREDKLQRMKATR